MAQNLAAMNCLKPYDVFISHAIEDRQEVADKIREALSDAGLRVWYSRDQLSLGEDIHVSIGKSLRQCRYGVVILSNHALQSSWIVHELFTLLEEQAQGDAHVIPIWHHVGAEEIRQKFPGIANVYSLTTRDGLDPVIERLKAVIGKSSLPSIWLSRGVAWLLKYKRRLVYALLMMAATLVLIAATWWLNSLSPGQRDLEAALAQRVAELPVFAEDNPVDLPIQELYPLRQYFDALTPGHDRHAFEFTDGRAHLNSKVSVQQEGLPVDQATLLQGYGMQSYSAKLGHVDSIDGSYHLTYAIFNQDPMRYEILEAVNTGSGYRISVLVRNPLRWVCVECHYSIESDSRFERIRFVGLRSIEDFLFENGPDGWQVAGE